MKNILLLTSCCLLACFTNAQKIVEKRFAFNGKESITLNLQIADSIRIVTWNKNEVYAKGSININENKDNDVYETTFDESGNSIEVRARFDDDKSKRTWNDSCRCCCNFRSKIYWDIYIPESVAFSVETIDGNITIIGNTGEIKAHSISGFIDMALVGSRKADLRMSTISGTIYTNVALAKPSHRRGGNEVSSELNGGGQRIDLETISGDIFLRKAE